MRPARGRHINRRAGHSVMGFTAQVADTVITHE
ncbi:hypothetical protein BN10_810006 [Phycicoccus elongatus Lp2]|uniref:Uncharacterized protein n=1 Tax=Phycicoccus elongatus Lp2 TaxID=1193181 RepID=N0E2G4_9MICO|nr:hypothetical protein BN10_810006 [Phycicoccus elongatus Lp2]